MANRTGAKWNKGGSKARKNSINIDFSAFSEYAEELDKLGADLQKIFGDIMEKEGGVIADDTVDALSPSNLPARGHYSHGHTKEAVVMDPKVTWSGMFGEMGLGFDKTKPGAGGFLITGTPRMQPDRKLAQIYSSKKYENMIRKAISEELGEEIKRRTGRFS